MALPCEMQKITIPTNIKPIKPHSTLSALSFPPQQAQPKSPGARHKAGSKLQVPNKNKACCGLFYTNTNIDR
jgi:hypothetical protein